ncbi:MAG: histidinol phosphate phosphatase domain-containing protein [Thermodesulfovibrionales bacterium]|nr:histidinol phosphate phosphatase domain-containing protein [Thermodesulfovibrionales bacterium]
MIDLHTHSLFSDGELVPSELVRRAYIKGYKAIAITDHVDCSNLDFVVPRICDFALKSQGEFPTDIIPGAEITHVPPAMIGGAVQRARELGAKIVVVHGQTPVEPVIEGTNRAGIESGADILAHPGLISKEEVILAAQKGVALEITARKGHCLTNGHVARLAKDIGAMLVINTDAHSPSDLIDIDFARVVLLGAGLNSKDIDTIMLNTEAIVKKTLGG